MPRQCRTFAAETIKKDKDMKTNHMVQKALGCLALVMGLALLTSCDEDDKRSYKLSGDWYGDFGMYYYTNRGQRFDSYDTEIQFVQTTPWTNHGYGTQVDWYKYGPFEYIYHQFRWKIVDGVLFMNYKWESEWDATIYDYHMSGTTFTGYFGDSNEKFYLKKIYYDCDFSPYYYEDYGWGYYDTYPGYNPNPYWAPGKDRKPQEPMPIDTARVEVVMRGDTAITYPRPSEIHFGNRFSEGKVK